ncbi:MAG: helicase-associated domain-containing protein [Rhodococcus sp. (in: high G+C Gram-positive bacteria)]
MTTYEQWLADLDEAALTQLLARRSDAAVDPPPRTYSALAHLLRTPVSVSAALRSLDHGSLVVLEELQHSSSRSALATRLDEGGVNTTSEIDLALGLLVGYGLAWPAGVDYAAVPLNGLRLPLGDGMSVAEPVVAPSRGGAGRSQELNVARFCELVDAVVEHIVSENIPLRKAGGVGVRDLRLLGAAVNAEHQSVVELALELAVRAGLADARGGVVRAGAALSAWAAWERPKKLSTLIAAWWCTDGSPTHRASVNAKPVPALGLSRHTPSSAVLRHAAMASVPDHGFVDEADAVRYLEWKLPVLVDAAEPGDPAALWREASWLGVLAEHAPTELSRVLGRLGHADTAAVEHAVLPVVTRIVERSESTLRLLPDLTAVVSGPVGERVSQLLGSCADAVRKDAASTWQFTPASIGRYHAHGGDADALLAALSDAAVTDIPQALDYLIRDGARSVATGSDVAEAARKDSGPARARHVDRASSSITRSGTDPAMLAAALTSGTTLPVDADRVARTIRAWCALPARDLDVLARAVASGGGISVDVADPKTGIAKDEIDDAVLAAGVVHGRSQRTGARRSIELSRIRMVRETSS